MSPGLVGGVSVSPVTGETVKDRPDDGAAGTSVFGVNHGCLVSGLTHPVRHTSNPVNAQALEHWPEVCEWNPSCGQLHLIFDFEQ